MNRTLTLRPFNRRESAPFSGTGSAVRRAPENIACALSPRRNPSDLGSRTASHPMNARAQACLPDSHAEICPTETLAPFSGTGTPACAPLLRRNPSDLGLRTASHPMNARGQAEACPTRTESIAPPPMRPLQKTLATGKGNALSTAALLLAIITLATIAAPAARAQGSRKDDIVFGPAGHPVARPDHHRLRAHRHRHALLAARRDLHRRDSHRPRPESISR